MSSPLTYPSAYPARCDPLPCKLRLPRWASPLGNSYRSCNSCNKHNSHRSRRSQPHPSHQPPAPLAPPAPPAMPVMLSAPCHRSLWTLWRLQKHRRRLLPRQRCRPSRRHQGLRPVSVCRCTRRCSWLLSVPALQTRSCRCAPFVALLSQADLAMSLGPDQRHRLSTQGNA